MSTSDLLDLHDVTLSSGEQLFSLPDHEVRSILNDVNLTVPSDWTGGMLAWVDKRLNDLAPYVTILNWSPTLPKWLELTQNQHEEVLDAFLHGHPTVVSPSEEQITPPEEEDEIVEFDDVFDNVLESYDMDSILTFLDTVLDGFTFNDGIAIDIKCFTKPYTKQVDLDGVSLYQKIVSRGLIPVILSWEQDLEENIASERAKLTSWGVSPNVQLILRNFPSCPYRKKGMSFSADMCGYTHSRVSSLGHNIVMYVGRMWVDVLPFNLESTALPSVSPKQNFMCRHTSSGVWSLRMSPSKK
jgi:hypothetical protein